MFQPAIVARNADKSSTFILLAVILPVVIFAPSIVVVLIVYILSTISCAVFFAVKALEFALFRELAKTGVVSVVVLSSQIICDFVHI